MEQDTEEAEDTAPELKALATAYGECLWVWSCIEAQLFLVFMAASGLTRCTTFEHTERRETLARAFFAVHGMKIRMDMTHALAQQRWEKSPHLATWKPIYKELNKQRGVRGQIGHRIGFPFPNPDSGKPPIALLIDPRLHFDIAAHYQSPANRGMSLDDILQIHQEFRGLQKRMADFVVTLVLEQHVESPQPQADPPLPLSTQDNLTPKESP